MKNKIESIIIDWGTTNFRAFALSDSAEVIDSISLPQGLLQIEKDTFSETLEGILASWLDEYAHIPIKMSGMVGSAKGWINVPYVHTPAQHDDIYQGAYKFVLPWGAEALIFPGLAHHLGDDKYDVMRGEEIQLLGLATYLERPNFFAILPGTHSKHVQVVDNQIVEFMSFLTGEMYSVLLNNMLLGKDIKKSGEYRQSAFLKGVLDAQGENLSHVIFLAWTHRLFKNIEESDVADYLSGIMIGNELSSITHDTIYIVGNTQLSMRYSEALEALNKTGIIVPADTCFLKGMTNH